MFKNTRAFSGFSVDDLKRAKAFYGEVLGLDVREEKDSLELRIAGGARILIYPKPNHTAATYTILNFPVDSVERAVDALTAKGVKFEHYDDETLKTDAKGISRGRGCPTMAWFKDPAGNFLSVIEEP